MTNSRYQILGEIGQGQFGRVFCASHRNTGQLVALKQLDHRRFPTHRFLRELTILVVLNHPHIVGFHAIEYISAGRYIVMDYCQGGTLRQLIESKTTPSILHKLQIVRDILLGLDYVHRQGIIHCDLKPENILLDVTAQGWSAKIADFGIARFRGTPPAQTDVAGGDTGSPAYMAPERFYGHFSVESDIYAIGVMLFELIVGWRPFSGMPIDVMKAHLNQPLRIPKSVPARLKEVLQKALQKLPQHRYSSAEQMRLDLEPIIAACGPHKHEQPTRPQNKLETAPLSPDRADTPAVASPEVASDLLSQPDPDVRQIVLAPEQLQHQAQLTTPVHRLWMTPQGCFGLSPTEGGLGLWLWADQGLQQVGQLPIQTTSLEDTALLASRAVDLSADGRQLAVLQPSHPIARSEAQSPLFEGETESVADQLTLYSVPHLRALRQCSLSVALTRLRWMGTRHLIGTGPVLTDLSQPAASDQSLHLLNRRGHYYWACPVRAEIQHVVVSSTRADRLFAIAQGPQPAAFFLTLRPFRAQRISLAMQPQWVSATQWGYILADPEGRIHCLNRRGRLLAQAQLPIAPGATLQAIAATASATLWIAMTHADQTHLVTLDLSPHLPQSLRRL